MLRLLLLRFLFAVPILAFVSEVTRPQTAATRLFSSDSCDVAVIGGGFGGLYTALAISREAQQRGKSIDVALVEPSDSFVFLPLLYDLTVGTATEAEVCPPYAELLEGTCVRLIQASLESIDNSQSATLKPASPKASTALSFRSAVISVGASPESIMKSVPGALEHAQPFYTDKDAKATRRLLSRLKQQTNPPRIAIVGGGFGGVELAASVKRKIRKASVTLLSRGAPMAGTRAETLIDKALEKLGVVVEQCSVQAIDAVAADDDGRSSQVTIQRTQWGDDQSRLDMDPWDAVMWTAGSRPTNPVSGGLPGLRRSDSGRLAIDSALRCFECEDVQVQGSSSSSDGRVSTVKTVKFEQPPIWALGDCAEIVSVNSGPAVPKTAQAAMQQAEVAAHNVLEQLDGQRSAYKKFQYQDLGSMLTLGGPNGAVMAPRDGAFAPVFAPLLDTAGAAFALADKMLEATVGKPALLETLGLSLGSYGIAGAESGSAPGTLAGTLTGAARRAVYAARMPTNRQRAVAATSAAITTAVSLAQEATEKKQG
ncbi:NADH dehydrogenase [Seminavis robusta]|uniref:NADH dehydrogenase n=1 Tax=Seminavis robusta TaxID=568900 RepID=A0A9N8ECN6_9STRA|nr:NADH dehydrogenase [Seminavis robusta]|eukprot:Sro809_g205630.1 NADH dehydrogenase (540) ;mRNA; r:36706-38325